MTRSTEPCGAPHPYAGRPCSRPAGHPASEGHGNDQVAWLATEPTDLSFRCPRCSWATQNREVEQHICPEPTDSALADHAYSGNRSMDTCWVPVDGAICRRPVEEHPEATE